MIAVRAWCNEGLGGRRSKRGCCYCRDPGKFFLYATLFFGCLSLLFLLACFSCKFLLSSTLLIS